MTHHSSLFARGEDTGEGGIGVLVGTPEDSQFGTHHAHDAQHYPDAYEDRLTCL
jgi:hypothetical protein